jgi:hypothetical protein
MVEGKFEFVDSQHGKSRWGGSHATRLGRGRQTRILTRQRLGIVAGAVLFLRHRPLCRPEYVAVQYFVPFSALQSAPFRYEIRISRCIVTSHCINLRNGVHSVYSIWVKCGLYVSLETVSVDINRFDMVLWFDQKRLNAINRNLRLIHLVVKE